MQWWRCEVEKRAILAKIVEWEIAYETCMLGLKKKTQVQAILRTSFPSSALQKNNFTTRHPFHRIQISWEHSLGE